MEPKSPNNSTSYSGIQQLNEAYEKSLNEKKKSVKNPKKKSNEGSDELTFIDFYKMSSTRNTTLHIIFFLALSITAIGYFLLSELKLDVLPPLNTAYGWGIAFINLLVIQLLLITPVFLKALKLKSIYKQLPFALSGLGNLVHMNKRWVDFSTISVKLYLAKQTVNKEQLQKPLSAEELQEINHKILHLIVKEANRSLKRSIGWRDKPFFENKYWIIEANGFPAGYANWYVLGKILLHLNENLSTIESELGIIQSVQLEIYRERTFSGNLTQTNYQLRN